MPETRLGLPPFFKSTSRGGMLLLFAFLGVIWLVLIDQLSVIWSADPQYRYGWAVPILCLVLMIRKFPAAGDIGASQGVPSAVLLSLVALAAAGYAPTRLIQAANPDWRLVSWALALEVVGLTLMILYIVAGPQWLRRLAFPIAFFLVAVPWPSFVEYPLIQGLTRADTATAVELLDWGGVSALQHGNIIEVATGNVGVDEACSGIRSLQATLMISLFLGESYQLSVLRRIGLLLGGFALSFIFNLTRMCLLTYVAAHEGIEAVHGWHDPTGNTILVACCLSLWGLGVLLARRNVAAAAPPKYDTEGQALPAQGGLVPLLAGLLVWWAAVEVSVESWYRWHEAHLPPVKPWSIAWPANNPTFQTNALTGVTLDILHYDLGLSASWKTADTDWRVIFLQWNPQRPALAYAKAHTPDVCVTASGNPTKRIDDRFLVAVAGAQLPFQVYSVADTPQPMYVFYCIWNDRLMAYDPKQTPRTFGDRLDPVLAGVRFPGHHSLEVAVSGNLDEDRAKRLITDELGKLLLRK